MKQINRKLFLCIVSSLFILALAAIANGEDTWRPIDPNELAQKEPKVEKDADAEAIFWDVKYDGNTFPSMTTSTYIRVKIFNERGRDAFSKVQILNLPGYKIENLAARVIKPNGTIVETQKLDIFESIIAKTKGVSVRAKSFVVPGLEIGSILEYRYTERIENTIFFSFKLEFQKEIPLQSITNCARIKFFGQTIDIAKYHASNMGQVEFVKKDNFYCATKTNVPSFHPEPMTPPEETIKFWVETGSSRFYLEKETDEKFWAGRAGGEYQYVRKYIEPDKEVKKAAIEIIGDVKTDEEKLTRLFEFCKTQIRNVDFDFAMTPKEKEKFFYPSPSASETLKRKAGRRWDITGLFISLAMAAGFDARVVLTSNKKDANAKDETRPVLKRSCAGVLLGGERVLYFAPTEIYLPMGMLPWEIEGQKSVVSGPKTYFIHKTPLSAPEKSVQIRSGKFKLTEDGTLEGKVHLEFTGHIGRDYKKANDELTQIERENSLHNTVISKISVAEISNIRIENVQDPIKNFTYTFTVRVPNYAQRTGKRLFVQPNFFEYGSQPLFVSNTRIHPIFFEYAWSEEDNIEIEIPKDFEIELEKTQTAHVTGHFIGSDDITIAPAIDGKSFKYKRIFKFGSNGQLLYQPDSYQMIKNFFDNIHKNAARIIILKQK